MDIISNLCIITLMSLSAVIAGIFGNLEADITFSGNLNSQISTAPKEGNIHKLFTKAVKSEPLFIGTMATISGAISYILLLLNQPILVVLILSPAITTLIQVIISITSYMGRMTSQALYNQPLFMDVLYKNIPIIAACTFTYLFSINLLSYLMIYYLEPVISITLPILEFLVGVVLGALISIIGNVHFGTEQLYQHSIFGRGISEEQSQNLITKDSLGSRDSIDILYISSKFSGYLTGLCFGLVIFLTFWIFIVFGIYGGIIVGFILILVMIFLNYILDKKAHEKYGVYRKNN